MRKLGEIAVKHNRSIEVWDEEVKGGSGHDYMVKIHLPIVERLDRARCQKIYEKAWEIVREDAKPMPELSEDDFIEPAAADATPGETSPASTSENPQEPTPQKAEQKPRFPFPCDRGTRGA